MIEEEKELVYTKEVSPGKLYEKFIRLYRNWLQNWMQLGRSSFTFAFSPMATS